MLDQCPAVITRLRVQRPEFKFLLSSKTLRASQIRHLSVTYLTHTPLLFLFDKYLCRCCCCCSSIYAAGYNSSSCSARSKTALSSMNFTDCPLASFSSVYDPRPAHAWPMKEKLWGRGEFIERNRRYKRDKCTKSISTGIILP